MFNFADVRRKARQSVHRTMGLSATYSDSNVSGQQITARLHFKSAYIGSYDEFSPGYFSEINRVIVDLSEVTPERGGTFSFTDYPSINLTVENVQVQGDYALCEVRL